ncbi:DedA family protein [Mesorhizobium sp. LHD-90]|uniref:DedA family protein n=1 Tax=Mesorhizobium sp. LHD-90 TaxID=3071414 RepID=UPI0027DEB6AB|nr:DedA family protein [Mesorhizobium sp. LHD-90]MDQ6437738.1 DedA family protein [Mesorhizobium sp. LHD-90]
MSDTIHLLVERYGLIAVFIGCLAEGETAAILGGFFAHQAVFVPWQAFLATFLGAFGGDTFFFLMGRRFADHRIVRRLRAKPGFSHAHEFLQRHPNLFVFCNRFIYGMRLFGGVAAGLSEIPFGRFVVINALSSLVWASLFGGLGYFFGLGAETLLGETIRKHHRLLIALGIGVAALVLGHFAARWILRRQARQRA